MGFWKKMILAVGGLILFLGFYTFHRIVKVPDVYPPMRIVEGGLTCGRMHIKLENGQGEFYRIIVERPPGSPKEQYQLVIQQFPQSFPIPYRPTKGGDFERKFIAYLERWSEASGKGSFREAYDRLGPVIRLGDHKETGDLYYVYTILRSRRGSSSMMIPGAVHQC